MTFTTFPATASAAWAIPGLKRAKKIPYRNDAEQTQRIHAILTAHPEKRDAYLHDITRLCCEHFLVSEKDVKRKGRSDEKVIITRHVCIYLSCKFVPKAGLKKISELYGGKEHSRAIYSRNYVIGQISSRFDNEVKTAVKEIESKLQAQWQ